MTTQHTPHTVVRNRDKIEDEYNKQKWAQVRELVDGLDNSVSQWEQVAHRLLRGLYLPEPMKPLEIIVQGKPVTLPSVMAWQTYWGTIAHMSARICEEVADGRRIHLVELGSGFGLHLFALAQRLPRTTSLYCAEITSNGRAAFDRIAAHLGVEAATSVAFDFYNPDYSFIEPESDDLVVLLTCTAIEQIGFLPKGVFDPLLDRSPNLLGLHWEPVGWQFRDSVGEGARTGSSREHAEHNDYNRNLWDTLQALTAKDGVELKMAIPDFLGANTRNTLSLITWQKTPT